MDTNDHPLRVEKTAPWCPWALAFSLMVALGGCSKSPDPSPREGNSPAVPESEKGPAWFAEVGRQAGLDFRHSSGHSTHFYMPEMVTGGVGLLDYDADGLLDVFCVNGGSLDPTSTNRPGSKLYHNLGNWKFADVTAQAHISAQGEYGMGCACADFNEDGHVDIYLSHLNGGILYRNNGDGTFKDVTREAGLNGKSWGTSAAFFDYDGDGHLDLIVANYLRWSRETELTCYSRGGLPDYCSPLNYKAPAMDTLYHNNGNGTFENVTLTAGLDKAYGNGLGVGCADFNRDGRIDIFIANDGMPNQLWINQGNGKFIDEAWIRGCAVNSIGMPRAGMGVSAVDIRQCGWLDLFVTHLVGEGNGWFVNTKGYFVDTIASKGPNAPSMGLTGFGVGFADFDNDGNLDAYIANGRVKYGSRDSDPHDPYAEPNTLLRGLGNGDFEEMKPQGGTAGPLLASSRGAALGDLDNDGQIDVVVLNKDGPIHLLRNVAPKNGNWIMFRLTDRNGVDPFNARVQVEANGRKQYRDVMPNQGYCSSNDPRLHFGLGSANSVERLIVHWPNGKDETFGPFKAGTIHSVREGTGQPVNTTER